MLGLDVRLIASFCLAIAFDVAMPFLLARWVRRRLGFARKTLEVGALAFALSQLLTRVPAVQVIQYQLREELKSSQTLLTLWIVALSLSAGVFEETARFIAFKYPLKDFRRWRDAVGFGIGHGGLESAVLVGGMAIIGLINVVALSRLDPSTLPLPAEQLEQIRAAKAQVAGLRWWEPLLGAYERVGAMAFHIAMSVLVLQRFLRDQLRWYWLALGLHTLFNLLAALVARAAGNMAAEGVVTVFALLSLWIILRLREEGEGDGPTTEPVLR
ncbi:YhfC family intramembrane metalloprotease [Cystobacter fuscus]|uniref:YhfC family intramembrane metalloprotease n=1 Tax=Cystobacter fuscus TaxID=43 RepID=UPI002B2A997D|nr:YhfC family intramembrane metalloprotease [Cystobacter fuscus]